MYFSNGAVLSIHQKHFISIFFFFVGRLRCAFFSRTFCDTVQCVLFHTFFFGVRYSYLSWQSAGSFFVLFFFHCVHFFWYYFFFQVVGLSFCLYITWLRCVAMIANIQQWNCITGIRARAQPWDWALRFASKTMIRLGLNVLGNWFTTTFCRFFFCLVYSRGKKVARKEVNNFVSFFVWNKKCSRTLLMNGEILMHYWLNLCIYFIDTHGGQHWCKLR